MDQNKVAIVTGGSRGIGRAIVQRLALKGMTVYFNFFHDEAGADETLRIVENAGGIAKKARLNITVSEEIETFVKTVLDEKGKIDVLVNNAGIAKDNLLIKMKEDDWDFVLDTNLKGTFLCIKAVLRSMIKQRYGRIVNISSVVALSGNPGQANYAASKAGIIGLTKSVASEIASRNITVNAVAPGLIETDMTNKLGEQLKESLLAKIPMQRFGSCEDVAKLVDFLVSDDASYITGQVIQINGGLYT